MAGDLGADGVDVGSDEVGRLTLMSNRTCMMAIEQVLRSLPHGDGSLAAAAGEVRGIARRLAMTAQDFQASLQQAG